MALRVEKTNPITRNPLGVSNGRSSSSIVPIQVAQAAIGGTTSESPTHLTFWQKAKNKCTLISNTVRRIAVDEPKERFSQCLSAGVGGVERWKDWGGLKENVRSIELIKTNNYVQKMWSPEYFVTCKADAAEGLDTLGKAAIHLGAAFYRLLDLLTLCLISGNNRLDSLELLGKNFVLFLEDIGNLLLVGGKLLVNVEILNFVKGAIGAALSALCFVGHGLATAGSALPAFFAMLYKCYDKDSKGAQEIIDFFMDNLKNTGKDFISTLACLGHAIPSWLPLVLTFVVPPVGIGLFVLKLSAQGTKYLGITDVVAYGGTFALLKMDQREALRNSKIKMRYN